MRKHSVGGCTLAEGRVQRGSSVLVGLLFIYETRSINNAHQKPAPPDQTCVLLRRRGSRLIGQLFFFLNAESKTSETIQSTDEAICRHMGNKNVAIPCGNNLK